MNTPGTKNLAVMVFHRASQELLEFRYLEDAVTEEGYLERLVMNVTNHVELRPLREALNHPNLPFKEIRHYVRDLSHPAGYRSDRNTATAP